MVIQKVQNVIAALGKLDVVILLDANVSQISPWMETECRWGGQEMPKSRARAPDCRECEAGVTELDDLV